MKSRWQILALGGVLVATIAGFGMLFSMRMNRGDTFPLYSTLRADPLGTRLLWESLRELPGVQVTRRFERLDQLASEPRRAVVIAGISLERWENSDEEAFQALDRTARGGSRVIIAFRAEHDEKKESAAASAKKKKAEKKPAPAEEKPADAKKPPAPKIKSVNLGGKWAAPARTKWLMDDAKRTSAAPGDLPERLRWGGDIFFAPTADSPWTVLYRRGGEPVLMERPLGRGSIVVAADSYLLSNEALQRDRAPALLAWLIAAEKIVEFDEGHLGVIEDRGIAALARSYGLTGAAVAFLVAAALFVWNRMALFVPPAPEGAEVALNYNQVAGLEALMRRTFSRGELVDACVKEWRTQARPADVARVDEAVAAQPKSAPAAVVYNAAVRALKRRGRG